jgi:hypothetical protein
LTAAHVAHLVIIKKNDKIGGGSSERQPALEIDVTEEMLETLCHGDDCRPELGFAKAR